METKNSELSLALHHARQSLEDDFNGDLAPVDQIMAVIYELADDYDFLGYGRSRIVFSYGNNHVVKVPISNDGFMDSGREARTSAMEDSFIPIADCHFIPWDEDFEVLLMERVTPIMGLGYSQLPDWVGYVDCAQVGYNSRGAMVAYDL